MHGSVIRLTAPTGGPNVSGMTFALVSPLLAHLPTADSSPIWSDLISMGIPPGEKVLRTVAVYLGIAVIIRVAGKRLMTQMNSLDLVVVLLLSNVVQNAIIGDDNSLTGGLLGAVVLVAFNAGLDRLTLGSRRARWIVEGMPTPLVEHGRIDEDAMRRLGVSHQELDFALRHQGADDIREVASATISPVGGVTVNLEPTEQNVSRADLAAAVAELKDQIAALDRRGPSG